MAKFYTFIPSCAPEEGLNIPHPVRVWGDSMADAAHKVRRAMAKDPKMVGEHKEFEMPKEIDAALSAAKSKPEPKKDGDKKPSK